MMPNTNNTSKLLKVLTLIGLCSIRISYAAVDSSSIPTLDIVIGKITDNIPQLMQLVTAFAYILGMTLVIRGVIELKHFGEGRTMMSMEHSLKKPLLHIFVGAALMYLPSSIHTGLYTLWTAPNPLAYVPDVDNPWTVLINNSFLILQLIGVIAFIRGLLILSNLGGHGGQPGTFARGMTHIIGGILCINMYDTVRMILVTLGLDTVLS